MVPLLSQPRRPMCGCGFTDVEELKRQAAEAEAAPKLSAAEKTARKLDAIRAAREHGKQLFAEGKYDAAYAVFERGVLIASGLFDLPPAEQEELSSTETILDLNMAACALKLQRWSDAINQCRLALQIEPNNVKAHYRWGCALMGLGELDEARAKFERAMQLDSSGACKRDVTAQLAEIRRRDAEQRQKSKLFAEQMKKKLAAQKSLAPDEEEQKENDDRSEQTSAVAAAAQ